MKYSAIVAIVYLSILLTNVAQAQPRPAAFDITAYKDVVYIPAVTVVVPTVVEVPFTNTTLAQPSFSVVANSAQRIIPHYWRETQEAVPLTIFAVADGYGSLQRLVDGNHNTSEQFPLPAAGPGSIRLNLETEKSIPVSSLTFTFPKNVKLPLLVSIEMVTPTGVVQKVLAQTSMQSNIVLFPVVETQNLQVTLTYGQPLSISEVSIGEEDKVIKESAGLRFLAQPNESYTVYLNPDRPVGRTSDEAGNLTESRGVILLAPAVVRPHSQYRPNDSDDDGIIETLDNCPNVINPNQSDINNNGVGDECDDYDRDGVINTNDNCSDTPNENQADEDADGLGDVCDDEESRLTEKYAGFCGLGWP